MQLKLVATASDDPDEVNLSGGCSNCPTPSSLLPIIICLALLLLSSVAECVDDL